MVACRGLALLLECTSMHLLLVQKPLRSGENFRGVRLVGVSFGRVAVAQECLPIGVPEPVLALWQMNLLQPSRPRGPPART